MLLGTNLRTLRFVPEHGGPASTSPAPVFGRSGDVPRRCISESDYQNIIIAEVSERSTAADEYARLGRDDVAARRQVKQATIELSRPARAPNN